MKCTLCQEDVRPNSKGICYSCQMYYEVPPMPKSKYFRFSADGVRVFFTDDNILVFRQMDERWKYIIKHMMLGIWHEQKRAMKMLATTRKAKKEDPEILYAVTVCESAITEWRLW